MADMTSEARVVCLDRLWPDDRLAGRAAGLGSTAGGGVGEHRWLPASVGGIQVDAGRHDLVDPVEDSDAVEEGIAAALAHDGPALIDAVVARAELVMPPAITVEMAKGFTLYMLKAVISGRTNEILDLAATNLWR